VTAADIGRIDLRKAWALTRGALPALIVTTLVIFGVQLALWVIVGGAAALVAAGLGGGEAGSGLWFGVAGQAAGVAVNTPLITGLQLYVYRAKRGDPAVAQTFA